MYFPFIIITNIFKDRTGRVSVLYPVRGHVHLFTRNFGKCYVNPEDKKISSRIVVMRSKISITNLENSTHNNLEYSTEFPNFQCNYIFMSALENRVFSLVLYCFQKS